MVILGLISSALLYGLIHLTTWHSGITVQVETYLIVLFWAFYNASIIVISVWEVLKKQHERKQYRFQVDLEGEIFEQGTTRRVAKVRLNDLSLTGAGLNLCKAIPAIENLSLQFDVPGYKRIILPIKAIHYQFHGSHKAVTAGISFGDLTGISRQHLFEYLFVILPCNPPETGSRKSQQEQLNEFKSSFEGLSD